MHTGPDTPTRKPALIQWTVLVLFSGVLGVLMSINMALEHRYTDTREQRS